MSASIYVRKGSEQFGPYDRETLIALMTQGQLSPKDLAWHETAGDWKPLAQMLDLKAGDIKAASASSTTPAVAVTTVAATGQSLSHSEVVITGIKIPFLDLVVLILKVWVASIPAMIIIWVIMAVIMLMFGALFGSVFSLHSFESH